MISLIHCCHRVDWEPGDGTGSSGSIAVGTLPCSYVADTFSTLIRILHTRAITQAWWPAHHCLLPKEESQFCFVALENGKHDCSSGPSKLNT